MATGDLKGNLRKIEQGLRLLNYPRDVDYTGLAKGDPSMFLPIISYCFTSFSTHITELLVESDVELTAKNDLRFIEAVYKLLRDQFQYKPVLSKQQFLSCGFAERKIQVVCDIISLVYKRHKELSNANKYSPALSSNDFWTEQDVMGNADQHVSRAKKPGVDRSRSLITTCTTGDVVREVLDKEESGDTCVAYGMDSGADRLDSVCEQSVSLTKIPGVEHSRSLVTACIPGDIVKEVLEKEENGATSVAYGLDSEADRLDSVCEQDTRDENEMEKLMSRIAELEEKLNKLSWMEDKFQVLEEKLHGKIIVDMKDWKNLLSRVLLLETQLLLHSREVDISTDINNLGEENISAHNVSPVSPDREKGDLPESLHQSSGYSSLLSAEPSPRAMVINNHGPSEISKDTTIQRMERISKMIEETSELLKTSSNTS